MNQVKDSKRDTKRLSKEQNTYKGLLRDTSFLYEDKVMELSLLRRVGDILGYILDLESFYRMFVDILLEETNAENCSFMVMDNETNELGLKMARGRNDNGTFFDYPADSGVTFYLGEGVVGKAALARETILIDDVSKDERFEIRETRFPIGSLLCTPLIFQEKVLGVINLSHSQPRAFGQNNKRIMELLCAFVSSIIGNATDYIKARDQEKFKAMFEGVRLSILLIDPEIDRIVDCNGYTKEWLGYSKEELVSMENAFDILPPGYREKAEQILKKIIETNNSEFNEISFIKKDSSVKTGEISGTTISYQGKNVVQLTVKDVTERKRSEERIKQLSRLKEELLSSGSLYKKLKCITDGVVEIFEADFSRIWITRPGDLCDSDCIHAEVKEVPHVCRCRDRCLHLMTSSGRYTHIDGKVHRRVPFGCYKIGRVAAGKSPKFLTNDVIHDSRVHDSDWAKKLDLVSFAGYRISSEGGEPLGVLALFSKHAISSNEDTLLESLAHTTSQLIQTNRAEEALKKSEERYHSLIEAANDAVISVNKEGLVITFNKKAEEMYGYAREEILGKSVLLLVPPQYREAQKKAIEKFKTIKASEIIGRTVETKGFGKDGREFSAETSIFGLEMDGECIFTSFVRDISNRKEMEHKLIQAEKLKSLGELSGGVAHDFNNVLAAILGRVQLLKMQIKTPLAKQEKRKSMLDLKAGLEVIERASLDGAETVRRIQEFSRRRTDDKNFAQVDINELVDNALEFTRVRWKNEAESKGIKIKIQKEFSLLTPITGSPSELREVFTNLINNAIDAMPQGGQIKITTFEEDSHISIKVEDTGISIPKDIKDRIFDPFFSTKGVQSTGLGLSVSYGIITRHRGTITVDSIEGEGTTFTIQLPLFKKTGSQKGKEAKVTHKSRKQEKARVLVIEDEEDVGQLLSDILTDGGHEVEIASNGSQGIKMLKKKDFDLVFTDLGMPGMSGWQVAEEVKRINKNIPVALITGWKVTLEDSELKKSGVDLVVNKPFRLDQVLKLVQDGMELREKVKNNQNNPKC